MSDLRQAFITNLIELADADKDIVYITGDLGFSFAEPFIKRFPKQYINSGCMEDTTIGIAAGMALAGKKPYVYSVINFLIFRAYEQVRNDICYQNTNVKLIGVRGKESYKFLGFSHNIVDSEDEKALCSLPNLERFYPQNEMELSADMNWSYKQKCPTYIRL